jgi:hypothetical protein
VTDQEILDRLKRRQKKRRYRYEMDGRGHRPRWPYDCSRCKFNWNCGELCSCNIREGRTPEARCFEVAMLLAVWRRSRKVGDRSEE